MAAKQKMGDGILYMLPDIAIKILCLLPLMFLWRVISETDGAEMSLGQMQTYTYANAVFGSLLNVRTFISSWNYDGSMIKLLLRPAGIFKSVVSETVGGWIPELLMFSLPMMLISPLFGISLIPQDLLFFPSLILCVSLGFAVDLFFACVAVYFRAPWLSFVIRSAVTTVFSGSIVPFSLLPEKAELFFRVQPFGSLAAAPISFLCGSDSGLETLLLQLFWNIAFWLFAILLFRTSRERLVSYGG